MRPIHAHEIDHVTPRDRLTAPLLLLPFLAPAWFPAGVWWLLLPWAAGGAPPDGVLLGSWAYAAGFAGWMTWEGLASVGARGALFVPAKN